MCWKDPALYELLALIDRDLDRPRRRLRSRALSSFSANCRSRTRPSRNARDLEAVVHLLAPLLDELVFVGGCTTGLLITDPAAGGNRPTENQRRGDHDEAVAD